MFEKHTAHNVKNESKLDQKRCSSFGQNGLPKWPLQWALAKVPPHYEKNCFWYHFLLICLTICNWMWEKTEAPLQSWKPCQGEIVENSVHADALIPQGRRPHSTQQAKKQHRKFGKSSVHVNDCFCASAAHQLAEQKPLSENRREFRPCRWLSSTVHRQHSARQSDRPLAMLLSCVSLCAWWLFELYDLQDNLCALAVQQSSRPGGMRGAIK